MAYKARAVRLNKNTGKRGRAKGLSQLSELQRSILRYLFDYHMIDGNTADGEKLEEFHTKGVPWSAKKFFDDCPTKSQTVTLSKSLKGLKRRGLIVTYDSAKGRGEKPRTTHVKLTDYAIELVFTDWTLNSSKGRKVIIDYAESLAASKSKGDEQKLKELERTVVIARAVSMRQALEDQCLEQLSEAEKAQAEIEEMQAALEQIEKMFDRPPDKTQYVNRFGRQSG